MGGEVGFEETDGEKKVIAPDFRRKLKLIAVVERARFFDVVGFEEELRREPECGVSKDSRYLRSCSFDSWSSLSCFTKFTARAMKFGSEDDFLKFDLL